MKLCDITAALPCEAVAGTGAAEREIECGFCCDLLSLAMSRAKENCIWLTVMGNVNTVAVASLCDVAAILVCEGVTPDADTAARCDECGIGLYKTELPVFEAAAKISEIMKG